MKISNLSITFCCKEMKNEFLYHKIELPEWNSTEKNWMVFRDREIGTFHYCPFCGAKIDWEEGEEEI